MRPFRSHGVFFILLSSIMAVNPQARAEPGDQLWLFQGIEDINAMAHLPDVDGDGIADILVESYDAGADGDHLYLLSGGDSGTPAVIWSARPVSGVSNGGGYGDNCLAVSQDLNGDAFPDVLLGTAWGNRSVHALNGLSGEVLWTFDTYDEPASGWIYSVSSHPDRTGDGVPEVVFGAGSDNETGYLLDGADGSVLWRFYGATDAIGFTLSLPDVNGDDVADVLFCGWDDEHRVFCVSGASGPSATQIWARDMGASSHAAALIDDIDGDMVPDLVVGTWNASLQVRCLSGATGTPRWSFDNGAYQYIMRLATLSDIDGDGFRDLAVGSWDNAVRVISGLTGGLIWESYAGSTNGGDFWAVDRVDDVTGDGLDEVVGGSFDQQVYLFDGADGDTLWIYNTARRLYTVRGAPDLSMNGSPDVLAGTQFLSWGGRAYAIEGGERPTSLPPGFAVSGSARYHDQPAPRVELDWICEADLPFRVTRVSSAQERGALDRRELALAHERGALDSRAILDAIRAEGPGITDIELNPRPLRGVMEAPDRWRYRFTDHDPGEAQCRYRLTALLPGGGEGTLLELVPGTAGAGGAPIGSASLLSNPFNPGTTVRFELSDRAELGLTVHDAAGRLRARQPAGSYGAGVHEMPWLARDPAGRPLPSGVYFLSLLAGDQRLTLRAVLLK